MKINNINTSPSINVGSSQNTSSNTPSITKSQQANEANLDETKVVQDIADMPKAKSAEKAEEAYLDPEKERELMAKSVEQANSTLKNFDRVIERSVHEVTGVVMYTIKDSKTKEVIAEYPPKKIQDMIAKMWELAGLVVDKRI